MCSEGYTVLNCVCAARVTVFASVCAARVTVVDFRVCLPLNYVCTILLLHVGSAEFNENY